MPFSVTDTDVVIEIEGSTAKIALHGAHVYSWSTAGEERLFLSSATSITGPAAIRGGIPICFPLFGPPPNREPFLRMKQHGFARNITWDFLGVTEEANSIQARFDLSYAHKEIQEYRFPKFKCVYTVRLVDHSLSTELEVTNLSEEKIEFQALLHTYLRIPDSKEPKDVRVKSLKGLKFTDKVAEGAVATEAHTEVDFSAGEVDRVYQRVPGHIEVDLGLGRLIDINTSQLPDLTLWNPHQNKSDAMADMEKDGWKHFICVEPGQTSFIGLDPSETWTGKQELRAKTVKL
ncbi:galactose mutarotase-like domain-containing protein [Phakopsora pachyrhizi]|uniref:Glucose-6-phosphate 1-epimerase n=1 Tax=Phakopsora pachyrhizi TaxID=170000 RepID=A0AAV0BU18_PHAPC|nr:galactose mutarotase-like domain-containing protein [Phakopsora pachyrhizi]CAH7689806.1 galactose mutarotase-like domain-containing protein [Phakopsora pachyrhizi]